MPSWPPAVVGGIVLWILVGTCTTAEGPSAINVQPYLPL
jgi:hypothetical protein